MNTKAFTKNYITEICKVAIYIGAWVYAENVVTVCYLKLYY